MYVTDEERLVRRAEKIESWFGYLDDLYGNLLSRPAETSSLSGWNDAPRTKPCECRPQWQRGRLCLACDNQGWRPIADGETGIDPYSVEIPKGGFKPPDEDAKDSFWDIQALKRLALVRDGVEIPEGKDAFRFRTITDKSPLRAELAKSPTLTKILWGLSLLLGHDAEAVRRASREALARALAHILPGRLYAAPV